MKSSKLKTHKFDMIEHLAEMEMERKLKVQKAKYEQILKDQIFNQFKPKHKGTTSQFEIDRLSTPRIGQLKATYNRFGDILNRKKPGMLVKFLETIKSIENDEIMSKSNRNKPKVVSQKNNESSNVQSNNIHSYCQPEEIWKVKEARHPERAEILCLPKKLIKKEEASKLRKPEDLEDEMRQKMSHQRNLNKRQYEINSLFLKIEKKVKKELLEEIIDKLLEKLPKMIVNKDFASQFSDNDKNIYDDTCKTLSNYSKCPTNDLEIENYCNFASIISEFVINSLQDHSISPDVQVRPLKTLQRNKDLMDIADKIVSQEI